ncbi:glycosyltransferase family 2 protein [Daejeonella sp.]|uniref:glycosyltransferase family 2 protein n=1 Tax=Daejeonella sp. TaxID=2805397 RepID=UPI0030BB0275
MFNNFFALPGWVTEHLYSYRGYTELSVLELEDLKHRLSFYSSKYPEVSVVIPAWNEENNLFRTLSSLASNKVSYPVEFIVVNNNSTDKTQEILDKLGVKSFVQPLQGITFARQLGLEKAKGTFHLCADSDTLYPPDWIELMVKPMRENKHIVGVYGRYSFLPQDVRQLPALFFYEKITGLLIRIRKMNREFVNVLGFNMGFITKTGRENGGFEVNLIRKFDNSPGKDFIEESEDGTMALNLLKVGRLKLVTNSRARVFTSSRRLVSGGGLVRSFMDRSNLHSKRMLEYIFGKK